MSILPEKKLNELVDLTAEDKRYLEGRQNWLIRMYYYLENGLNILNEFRNLFLLIAAAYITLKLESYGWLIAMTIPSVVLLIFVGRYNVHRLSKMKEWLSIRFSTHFGIKNFNHTERQTQLLEEILAELKNKK